MQSGRRPHRQPRLPRTNTPARHRRTNSSIQFWISSISSLKLLAAEYLAQQLHREYAECYVVLRYRFPELDSGGGQRFCTAVHTQVDGTSTARPRWPRWVIHSSAAPASCSANVVTSSCSRSSLSRWSSSGTADRPAASRRIMFKGNNATSRCSNVGRSSETACPAV